MEIGAVKNHIKSKQHDQIMKHKQSPYNQLLTFGRQISLRLPPTNLVNKFHHLWLFLDSSPSTSLIISEEMLHAEVFWVIKVITSHYSFSSCKDICCLFSKMFPIVRLHSHFHVELQSVLI